MASAGHWDRGFWARSMGSPFWPILGRLCKQWQVAAGAGARSEGCSLSRSCRLPGISTFPGFGKGLSRSMASSPSDRHELTAMNLYPYLVAAHVTAVAFFVGGMLAQDRMVHATAQYPQE